MSEKSNKTYRIRTDIDKDKFLDIQIDQDYENFEFLSLKLSRENIYKLHTSNYGCIAGRVLANDAFGIPNAKISVFIPTMENEDVDPILYGLYPYGSTSDENSNHIRYNTLPDNVADDICHQDIGTFPNKRLVLDDNNVLEIYDTYYKYSTITNDAGDYMIFGVPVGQQTIHVDIDLSDIGRLSQKPRDLIFKGYNADMFESTSKFKKDTNLNSLVQVISQDDTVDVKPFWGDESEATVAVTRNDIKIQYKFDTYCVFIGSIMTDNVDSAISKRCIPAEKQGRMDEMTTGQGMIEMIRKTPDGNVESVSIQGNKLIDGTGTWCYQIPMNLDYVGTDEYGNIVATNDPTKGIATRTEARFRISMTDTGRKLNNLPLVLVPNNPTKPEEMDYAFGSYTKDTSYRSLFYNNVYTVKSYIPRLQKGNNQFNKRYTAIKSVNAPTNNNRFPYNNMRVNVGFMFFLMCAILKTLIRIIRIVNKWRSVWKNKNCIVIGDGLCPDLEGWYFAPGCNGDKMLQRTLNNMESDEDESTGTTADTPTQLNDESSVEYRNKENNVCLTSEITYLMECVEINLAMEYNVINFDFYNDWVNGTIYMPKWYGSVRKKKSFLFGLIKVKSKTLGCLEDSVSLKRRYTQQCAVTYKKGDSNFFTEITTPIGCQSNNSYKCHKASGRMQVNVFGNKGGLVHPENTLSEDKVYYLKPCEFTKPYGDYYGKCNFFATDIVLLGSLSNQNDDGIPMIYDNIPSTTYQLPTNLALTNMDSEAYNYSTTGGTACTGKKISELKRVGNNTSEYNQWSSTTDAPESDGDEVAITEVSGIDWGYDGPDQYKDYDSLYQPSGHFLGVGCAKAETTIKSCVNLARVCELGAELSQRHEMVENVTSGGVSYYYVAPSGLINRYDIGDANYRRIFATLNYNKLNTKLDEETKYPKYEFISSMVNGFDGALQTHVDGNLNYNGGLCSGQTIFYRYTNETPSLDYERFRLGVRSDKDEEILSKYLIQDGTQVALPVYENSYYFYFGLQEGHSAYDRLIKDYYSICEKDPNGIPQLDLDWSKDSTGCDRSGSVKMTVSNYNGVYSIRVYNTNTEKYEPIVITSCPQDEKNTVCLEYNTGGTTIFNTKSKHFIINKLDSGKYKISITTFVDKVEYSYDVEIGDSIPSDILDIEATVNNFPSEYYNITDICDTGRSGYLSFVIHCSNPSYASKVLPAYVTEIKMYNNNGYEVVATKDESSGTWSGDNVTTVTVSIAQGQASITYLNLYCRDGNTNYYTTYKISCADGVKKEYIITRPYYVEMPGNIDFYVGTPLVTGRQLRNAGIDTSDYQPTDTARTETDTGATYMSWVSNAMANKNLTDLQKWIIEKSVVNSNNVSDLKRNKIPYGYCLGQIPYPTYITRGHGEKYEWGTVNIPSTSEYITTDYISHEGWISPPSYPNGRFATLVNGQYGYTVNHKSFLFSTCEPYYDRGRKYIGLKNIKYNKDSYFKKFCRDEQVGDRQGDRNVYGSLPYNSSFEVCTGSTTGDTATTSVGLYMPSIYMPMRSNSTFWLGKVDFDSGGTEHFSDTCSIDVGIENGVGYKVKVDNTLSGGTEYFALGDTNISIKSTSSSITENHKEDYAVSHENFIRTPYRTSHLIESGKKYETATIKYNNLGTVNFNEMIECHLDITEGKPKGMLDMGEITLKTLSNTINCSFITKNIFETKPFIVMGSIQSYSCSCKSGEKVDISNTTPNVKYYVVNKNFIDKYCDDLNSNLRQKGLFKYSNLQMSPINNPNPNDVFIHDITESLYKNQDFSLRVYMNPSQITPGLQCYVIGIVNPLTEKKGYYSDTLSEYYQAHQYMNGIDPYANFDSIIKIYKPTRL